LAPRVGRHYWGFIQDFFRDGVVMINVGYRLVWAGPPLNKFWIQNSVEKKRYRVRNTVKSKKMIDLN
jgi:hypothetical protein